MQKKIESFDEKIIQIQLKTPVALQKKKKRKKNIIIN